MLHSFRLVTCGMLDMHVNKVKKDDNPKNKHIEKQLITDKHKKEISGFTTSVKATGSIIVNIHHRKIHVGGKNGKKEKEISILCDRCHRQRVQMYMFDVNPYSESQITNASPLSTQYIYSVCTVPLFSSIVYIWTVLATKFFGKTYHRMVGSYNPRVSLAVSPATA